MPDDKAFGFGRNTALALLDMANRDRGRDASREPRGGSNAGRYRPVGPFLDSAIAVLNSSLSYRGSVAATFWDFGATGDLEATARVETVYDVLMLTGQTLASGAGCIVQLKPGRYFTRWIITNSDICAS